MDNANRERPSPGTEAGREQNHPSLKYAFSPGDRVLCLSVL